MSTVLFLTTHNLLELTLFVRDADASAAFFSALGLSVRGMMVEPSEVTDMDLYLMQHGQATTETEDPERPLTDAGRTAVQRVAKTTERRCVMEGDLSEHIVIVKTAVGQNHLHDAL